MSRNTRIWRVLHHHVDAARACADYSRVDRVGMDETAAARGQDYVSIFADMTRGKVLYATEGRGRRHRGPLGRRPTRPRRYPQAVCDTSSDMSAAYIAGSASASRTRR